MSPSGDWRNLKTGRMSDTRESWVTLAKFEAILFIGQEEGEKPFFDTGEHTDPMRLTFRFPGKRWPTTFNLTAMTGAEIRALREFLVRALDMAEPVCDKLDKYAAQAMETGDDTYVRLYRPDPEIVIRQRKAKPRDDREVPTVLDDERGESAHDPGIPLGPDRTQNLDGPTPVDGPGDSSSGVADVGPQDLGTQDHQPETYDGPFLRPVPVSEPPA